MNKYNFIEMIHKLDWDFDWNKKLIDFYPFEMLKKNKVKKDFDNIKKRLDIEVEDEDFISKEEMEI